MKFFMITNCPEVAQFAIKSGVDRIFVDTEILGKDARQGHLNTVISRHSLGDVSRVREVVPPGRLLVRINPLHANSEDEIDQAIQAGADILMLPMSRTVAEVQDFVRFVNGRAICNLLVETVGAADSLASCLDAGGIDEVHIGLNDLHLEMGLDFMFQPLASGLIDRLANVLRDREIPFGIGGLARVGEGLLPAELLLAEHVRLGSTAAILSRSFCQHADTVADIKAAINYSAEILALRQAYARYLQINTTVLNEVHQDVCSRVQEIVAAIRIRKGLH